MSMRRYFALLYIELSVHCSWDSKLTTGAAARGQSVKSLSGQCPVSTSLHQRTACTQATWTTAARNRSRRPCLDRATCNGNILYTPIKLPTLQPCRDQWRI